MLVILGIADVYPDFKVGRADAGALEDEGKIADVAAVLLPQRRDVAAVGLG